MMKNTDYDVYLYVNSAISEEKRKNILQKFCSYMEIGNSFWEYEDNCVLNNGIEIRYSLPKHERFYERY